MWQILLTGLTILIAQSTADQRGSNPKSDQCGCEKAPTHYRSLPVGKPVYGVQPNGNEIYVIRDSTPYIEVYDRNTFRAKRNVTVEGMNGPYDMVQTTQYPASLFVIDWFNGNNVTAVRVPQGIVSTWSVIENSFTTLGLAGSNRYTNGNILVTASTSRKLRKFNRSGNLINEITIQDITSPRQSIQVGPSSYAVCHGYGPPPELHRVCLIDNSGVNTKCYGGNSGPGVGQLDVPARLELFGQNGCILVADTGNKRVVLLNRNLEFVRNLISTGLDGPYRLFLDEERHLLYVADNKRDDTTGYTISGRVVIYKL